MHAEGSHDQNEAAAIEAYEDVMERPASPSSEASVDSTSHVDGADHHGRGADFYNQDSMQTFFEEMLAAGGGSGGGGGFGTVEECVSS